MHGEAIQSPQRLALLTSPQSLHLCLPLGSFTKSCPDCSNRVCWVAAELFADEALEARRTFHSEMFSSTFA